MLLGISTEKLLITYTSKLNVNFVTKKLQYYNNILKFKQLIKLNETLLRIIGKQFENSNRLESASYCGWTI